MCMPTNKMDASVRSSRCADETDCTEAFEITEDMSPEVIMKRSQREPCNIIEMVAAECQDDFNQWNRPLCKNVSYFRTPREVMRVYVVTIPFYNE